jgi:hypothetical protein
MESQQHMMNYTVFIVEGGKRRARGLRRVTRTTIFDAEAVVVKELRNFFIHDVGIFFPFKQVFKEYINDN